MKKFLIILAILLTFAGCTSEKIVPAISVSDAPFEVSSEMSDSFATSEVSSETPNSFAADSNTELEGWIGNYRWRDSYPPAVSDWIPMIEQYQIRIYHDEQYFAEFRGDGHQLGIRVKAGVVGDADSITLVFLEYLPDGVNHPFNDGDEILTIMRKDGKLITKWGQFIGPHFGTYTGIEGDYFQLVDVKAIE